MNITRSVKNELRYLRDIILYDLRRFYRFGGWRASLNNSAQRNYKAVKAYHSLEKSLSFRDRKQRFEQLPVCMAKTPASLSTDPRLKCRPTGFDVLIREVRLSAGAGFIVALTGDVFTMPRIPAENIDVDDKRLIQGLY